MAGIARTLKWLWILALLSGCADPGKNTPPQLQEWGSMTAVLAYPRTLFTGTRLWVEGGPFPDDSFGPVTVVMEGTFHYDGGFVHIFEELPAVRVREDRLYADLQETLLTRLCGGVLRPGQLPVRVWVRARSLFSGREYESSALPVDLMVADTLVPELLGLQADPFVYLEGKLGITARGLLLPEENGGGFAVVEGCMLPQGASEPCAQNGVSIGPVELPLTDVDGKTRQGGSVILPSPVFGVQPGHFTGSIHLLNRFADGSSQRSASWTLDLELLEVDLVRTGTAQTSLGGYVDIYGHAFVPAKDACGTTLLVQGVWTPHTGSPQTLDMVWIPEVVDGEHARHVLDEQSDLGTLIDLRTAWGNLDADITARVCCGSDCRDSGSIPLQLEILPVLQKVRLMYQDSWVSALEHWGLSGVDAAIRRRALEVMEQIYEGVHITFTEEPIEDYKLYSRVEIHGYDPNGYGLLGYDNSTGKDVENRRLHDVLGGHNALTQEDGFPGYGGVFLHSFFGFSLHPPAGVNSMEIADPAFDAIFDPFRPDRGGTPVSAWEAASFPLPDAWKCRTPNPSRLERISCAAYVLGTLLGSTLAHEIGHSLGLAQPYTADAYHNPGDAPLRLMDAGNARPFAERAGLSESGLEMFCDDDFRYLRAILGDPQNPGSADGRPGCGAQ